jgi:FkbM family methyltransferase
MQVIREQVRAPGTVLGLYGAGNLGRDVLLALRRGAVEPALFVDDTPAKQAARIEDLEVLSPEAAVERFGDRLVLAVTIWKAGARFHDIRERLRGMGAHVVSNFQLAWAYPDLLLPWWFLDHPRRLLEHREQILELAERLADDESRLELLAHVRFRLTLDFDSLPSTKTNGYFPPDVIGALPPAISFVDCGAYDGDTLREFLDVQGERFARAIAVEPDPRNRARLEACVEDLPAPLRQRIDIIGAAVGAEAGTARFQAAGNVGAALSATGDDTVQVVTLDDAAAPLSDPLYLKFDVEGAELAALRGAEKLIRERGPRLAVCAYHRPADLWEIPLRLAALRPDYRLYLRTHGDDGADLVCYAVPG